MNVQVQHHLNARLVDFASSLPIGTGFIFTEQEGTEVWTLRATIKARYGVMTSRYGGAYRYTIVDWDALLRGALNLQDQDAIAKVHSLWGEDEGVTAIADLLGRRSNRYRIHPDNNVQLGITAILPGYKGDPAEPVADPGTALEHVGGLPRLTGADRCDRCGAQALVAVRMRESGLRLDFCGHHYGKSALDLVGQIDAIVDQRSELVAR